MPTRTTAAAVAAPTPPRPLADGLADLWPLDRQVTFLNHGSFGSAPLAVLEAQSGHRLHIEARPIERLDRRRDDLLRPALAAVGRLVGADPANMAFVTNATDGINAVLRSLALSAGDEIVLSNHSYNAVRQTARYVARRSGARVVDAEVPFPLRGPGEVVAAFEAALGPRSRVVIVDHVTSPTAVVFPVDRIIAACRARGVDVLVDGAHAPGMIDLHVEALGAAWYTGNLHKWVCAPKGAAFLWARPDRQRDLHPTTISHHLDEGFSREFSWQATRDITAWMAAGDAIQFMGRLGWESVRSHNHELATWVQWMLCRRWGVEPATPPDGSMLGSMATVPLPEPARTRGTAQELQAALYDRHRIEVPIVEFGGARWLRASCQVYNTPNQYERLGDAVGAVAGT